MTRHEKVLRLIEVSRLGEEIKEASIVLARDVASRHAGRHPKFSEFSADASELFEENLTRKACVRIDMFFDEEEIDGLIHIFSTPLLVRFNRAMDVEIRTRIKSLVVPAELHEAVAVLLDGYGIER